MALVVHKKPQELTPAYNNQYITALSDQYAVTGFSYMVTVTVNGDTANSYTEDILPRPDGWLKFNAMQWVKNYVEHYFNPSDTGIVIATNKAVSVEVTVSEYGISPTDSETIEYVAFDACLTDNDFRNYDFEDYLFGENTDKFLLSKSGINQVDTTFTPEQDIWLHFFNGNTTPITDIVVELLNGITVVGGFSSTMPTPVLDHDMFAVNIGNISGAMAGHTVRVEFNGASGRIKRFTLTLSDICTKFTDYNIYYLDRNGALLSKHFEYKSTEDFTKKVNTVKLNKDVLNTTTGEYGSNTYDREEHVISTVTDSTMELNTGWITEAQSLLLKDLFDSPIVYVNNGSDLLSCRVTNTSFQRKIKANEKLFNHTITIDLGITETRQRGI